MSKIRIVVTVFFTIATLAAGACAKPTTTQATPPPATTLPSSTPPSTAPPVSSPPSTIPPSITTPPATSPATSPPATTPLTTPPPMTSMLQGPYDVWILGLSFNPQTLTVPVGTTVTWTNKDSVGHDVTSDPLPGPLNQSLGSGATYKFTFTTEGTYNYVCTIHPGMAGTVMVKYLQDDNGN